MAGLHVEPVDDGDSRVKYSGTWVLGGGFREFNHTTHGTHLAGANATFTFRGSSVEVYGTVSIRKPYINVPVSTYSLNGRPAETFHPLPSNDTRYRQLFYRSPRLDETLHTLTITSKVPNASFWLDYFEIMSSTARTTTILAPATFTHPAPSGLNDSFSTFSYVPVTTTPHCLSPPSSTGSPPNSTNRSDRISVIVGGTIGGLVLIFFIIFLVVCMRRKTRYQKKTAGLASWSDHIFVQKEKADSKTLVDIPPL